MFSQFWVMAEEMAQVEEIVVVGCWWAVTVRTVLCR